MNIDPITPCILHVTAKENVDISSDLECSQAKSLDQLLEDHNEKEENQEGWWTRIS